MAVATATRRPLPYHEPHPQQQLASLLFYSMPILFTLRTPWNILQFVNLAVTMIKKTGMSATFKWWPVCAYYQFYNVKEIVKLITRTNRLPFKKMLTYLVFFIMAVTNSYD